jgi:hypothetical protein
MDPRITAFINRLALTEVSGPVFNPYAAAQREPLLDRANAIRRQNLGLYLRALAAVRPWLILVGEAPGYRGCRLTGVPFTSEAIVMDPSLWPFGAQAGFRRTSEGASPVREATATMVWSALGQHQPPPLLWNAFPFHPHRPGDPWSNRRPLRAELEVGAAFLSDLLDLFRPRVMAAVGRSAAQALDLAGLSGFISLRHPAHGGKAAFVAGLAQIQPPAAGA